jgi:hypothetical protein
MHPYDYSSMMTEKAKGALIMTEEPTHTKVVGESQLGKSNASASLFTENADGTITITGAMMPRFDWTEEEQQAAMRREPGLQLLDLEAKE